MLKFVLFVALAANVIFIVATTEQNNSTKTKNTSNSSASSSSSSSASSSSTSNTSTSSSSSSQSSSSANELSNSTCSNDNKGKCTKPNEIYEICPPKCPFRTCGIDDRLIDCIPSPQPGDPECPPAACRCKPGFFRDDKGNCVKWEKCPVCKNPNEEYDPCPAPCPPRRCDVDDRAILCMVPPKLGDPECKPGCRCSDGYARNDKGICVPRNQCPQNQCNRPNEEYVKYPGCSPQTCDSIGKIYHCPLETESNSKGACRCKSGYYRNLVGECITKDECLMCNRTHEYFTCGGECDNVCSTIHQQNKTNCPIQNIQCNRKCYCEDGYARDSDNNCVPIEDCEGSCGGDPNARPGCGNCRKTCANYNSTDPIMCIQICYENGCDCLPGYVVDGNTGKCVLPENCTPVCGKDEIYTSSVNGGCEKKNCSQLREHLTLCIDPIKCLGGCICRNGYLRGRNGTCVPINQCDPGCPDGEDASNCPPVGCNSEYCPTSNNYTTYCPTPQICGQPKCVCEYGKRRDRKTGKCVSNEDCPPFACIGRNESYYDCPSTCPGEDCIDYLHNSTCPNFNILVRVPCQPHCRCDKGYYRNSTGFCVDNTQCTECPEGEIYTKCAPAQCDSEYCPISRNEPLYCSSTKECKRPRCLCGFNSHRDRLTGKCIPTSECPPFPCKGPNEEYQSCPPVCPGQNCSDYINNSTCPKIGRIGIVVPCKPQCRCINNTYRNTDGICVPADQCTQVTTTPVTPCPSSCENVDDELNNLEQGNTGFTGKFFYEVVKSQPGVSVIMSAFSVLTPLAELALYASGSSLEELLNVLNVQNKDKIRCVFPKIIDILKAQQNNTLDLGAKVFVNQDYPVTDEFKNDTRDVFDAEAENINVGDPDKAAATINDWAAEETRNKITDLITPDEITSLTRLILANAIYFKGTWKIQFDPKNTKVQDFSVTKNDVIQVKTMQVKEKFKYAESSDLNAKIIELPYVDDIITFVGILPNDIEGLPNLLEKLQDPNVFNAAINSLNQEIVTVSLPVMDISTKIDLTEILPKVNVTKIFKPETSGLSGIIKSNEPLYVSDGTQKATITVNEQGSEAAAANVVVVSTYSAVSNPPPEYFFNVDHPVAYYILFDNIPLFCGTFVKP